MWATSRDQKLIEWLSDLPRLSGIAVRYSRAKRTAASAAAWIIGQGFQPYHDTAVKRTKGSVTDAPRELTEIPFLPASEFTSWVVAHLVGPPWTAPKVCRVGYLRGYAGPHILVPQAHLPHFALQSRQNLLILQAAIGSDDKS